MKRKEEEERKEMKTIKTISPVPDVVVVCQKEDIMVVEGK